MAESPIQRTKGPPRRDVAAAVRAVPHVGALALTLPVSLERLFENALDWEHLPWIHAQSFSSIELLDAGDWGWRAQVGLPGAEPAATIALELRLDRELGRWVSSILAGPGAGSEIWTLATARGERETRIVIDFFVPGVEAAARERTLAGYESLYRRLYREDVAMMLDRQAALDERETRSRPGPARKSLGREDAVRARLPLRVELGGRDWRLVEVEGALAVHAGRCPHALGTLQDAPIADGTLHCPWHGYAFDLASGRCRSVPKLRLPSAPRVALEAGEVVLILDAASPHGR